MSEEKSSSSSEVKPIPAKIEDKLDSQENSKA